MQLLLRKVHPDDGDHHEYLDVSLDGDAITIGSSPSCDIQILGTRVKPIHARFTLASGEPLLRGEKKANKFVYKGKAVNRAYLDPGDEFSIEDQDFLCLPPPAGFDLALEWRYQSVSGHLLENAYCTSIDQLRFNTRLVSWVFVFLVLSFTGIAPVLDFFWRNNLIKLAATENDGNAWYRALLQPEAANSSRPTVDTFWLSGPLLPAHEIALGDRCEGCHQAPFIQVKDSACTICHDQMGDHIMPDHPEINDYEVFRCQNCHKEHSEPSEIVSSSDRLCSQCHATREPSVVEFSSGGHPEFVPTLLQPSISDVAGEINVSWGAIKAEAGVEFEEVSHLKYPHAIHLDEDKVSHAERGDALLCADCHQLNEDGEHFAPITMERHCIDCHDLSFDINYPKKQLPHGDSIAAYEMLRAHYVDLAFNPVQTTIERRRRPGQEDIDERCDRDYDCAIKQTNQAAQRQFEQNGCITCHEVRSVPGADADKQWQVLAVRLNDDWHTDAYFDHRSHLTPSNFVFGDKPLPSEIDNALCLSCHRADLSESSADVLMPQRSQCTGCHGKTRQDREGDGFVSTQADLATLDAEVNKLMRRMGTDVLLEMSPTSEARVTLNCISCHGYHRDEPPVHRATPEQLTARAKAKLEAEGSEN